MTLEFVRLAAATEVAATTVPGTLVESVTLALVLNNPEMVPKFKFELVSTLVITEGADTVPGALAVVPTVALVLCEMGVKTVPYVLGI